MLVYSRIELCGVRTGSLRKHFPERYSHLHKPTSILYLTMHAYSGTVQREPAHRRSIRKWRPVLSSLEARPLVVAGILACVYAALVFTTIGRRMWFDELFTYYIAQAPDMPRLFDAIAHVDLNPPLSYILVRFCHKAFGASEIATRLPSMVGFFAGSMFGFFFVRRRLGVLWGATAILFFWSTNFFRYATEARPYGLLLGFFSLTLFFYAKATDKPRCGLLPATGILLGTLGMMLSHTLAPLSILPFCVAEFVRLLRLRRIDWGVWIALTAPLPLAIIYISLARGFQTNYFPTAYQATARRVMGFYLLTFMHQAYLFAILAASAVSRILNRGEPRRRLVRSGAEAAFAITLLLIPLALKWIMRNGGGAFWPRYCLTTDFGVSIMIAAGLAWVCRSRPAPAFAAAGAILAFMLFQRVSTPAAAVGSMKLEEIRKDLPLVTQSGVTFLEMDHYESAEFLSRVHYLLDRDSAIRYAHATIFEGLPATTRYFPIRAHLTAYKDFIAGNHHFLVLAQESDPEGWLLLKLKADGARVDLRYKVSGSYADNEIFEVQM
jgi:hypothetical protein